MLSLSAGSQRRSTACPALNTFFFFFFALSLLQASTSSPTSVQPEIKKAGADRRACKRQMSLNASHKYLSQSD